MQILYDFDQLPQTLMLNPGAEVDYNKHVGVPFLSNIYFEFGASNKNITYNNVLSNTNGFTDVLRNIFAQNPDSEDTFIINQQVEIINAGLRLKNPDYYLSFGMYQEFEGFAKYPEDIANLYFNGNDQNNDGNPEVNEIFNFDQLTIAGDLVGVFHVGISKKVNDRLNIGGRLKLLSGSLNINSKNNNGNYYLSTNNTFVHNFNNMNTGFNTSGFINPDGTNAFDGLSQAFSGLFFVKGNIGLGMDLGFTYHATDNITVTGSILDLDFVNYTNKVTNYSIKGVVPPIDDIDYFNPPEGSEINYWQDKLTGYYNDGLIPIDTLRTNYNFSRSPKLNASAKYKLPNKKAGKKTAFRNISCDITTTSSGEELSSYAGIQVYTDFKPDKTLWAITSFYSRELSKSINAKITYTYDRFSAKNIGVGISTHIKSFNFYATADNLLALPKLKDSNYQSFQVGMNFIFNNY
jgi:Family of unknown function (DUF5723)